MRKIILMLTVFMVSISSWAGLFDEIGKDMSLAFGQCSAAKKAKVEAVLNNSDLSKATIISDGERPFKLYTKNNKKGLIALCKRDAKNLAPNQTLSGTRNGFYCGNKVLTCNVVTIHVSGGGGDNRGAIAVPPTKGDEVVLPVDEDDDDVLPPTEEDDDDVLPPTEDDDDQQTPPQSGDDDQQTPPQSGDDDQQPPQSGGGDTPNPVQDL